MEMQDQYDDAMFEYTLGNYDGAIAGFQQILRDRPDHFDAQLSLAMCHYRKGDFVTAVEEGHKAEKLKPGEQLVHTNLSLFYMKAGDKQKAEHHGLQARIASWRGNMQKPGDKPAGEEEEDALKMAQPEPPKIKPPTQFPDMPWKKKPPVGGGSTGH